VIITHDCFLDDPVIQLPVQVHIIKSLVSEEGVKMNKFADYFIGIEISENRGVITIPSPTASDLQEFNFFAIPLRSECGALAVI
jgi:hypothetical protein